MRKLNRKFGKIFPTVSFIKVDGIQRCILRAKGEHDFCARSGNKWRRTVRKRQNAGGLGTEGAHGSNHRDNVKIRKAADIIFEIGATDVVEEHIAGRGGDERSGIEGQKASGRYIGEAG
jgi:hypothetical protein